MDWPRDLAGWPNRDYSSRIAARPHRWHVQRMGRGPVVLLIHGAGGATHSWRDVMPVLAPHAHVVALDLPGQGFTQAGTRARSGLEPTAADIAALCADQGWDPIGIVGHSAGVAVALRLSQMLHATPAVVGINPALDKFEGVAGWLFPVLAKALALNPLTPFLFTIGGASGRRARQLIEGTGSHLADEGYRLYSRLMSNRSHISGTLQMMASWELDGLIAELPKVNAHTLFLAATGDRAVPVSVAERAAARMPDAKVEILNDLGHLAHEEAPEMVARRILAFLGLDKTARARQVP
ncbi:alpha/beta fold hydrolase [Lutimaribacter sp. EGI FJ00015]|uniref:Alpha/beta fold hydrolase n=1 Tax=Lutimaribacter degradans TaxID=2945989 RepID=A0ACC5ZW10_9RHOB|nr:alpha/beta fold hydrolase BchO [Lutimaribacter sp. EGI FJ00013]MCM2562025.1 alpha/beta fold hydrolase [Lutimaribacter sp. EGI FJ00013]MCO0612943.1 alpha/beta fold hydrolase [Lutimaribacter sp. EGI FJ00015]MCO0635857.1 alpha/beta fold hydrolase [Lutimaribacter sp. EGI FJ00014]